ncbi:hypothetical protein ACFQ88_22825 [Paenibacillus sp. NPDC056579]|uniref:hypothetical protein n=1 Tax=Paenibacillus sp. NPDC056579 TaxID=3345871 RepID=UPI0036B6D8E3
MKATIPTVVEIMQYGARPDSGEDATLAVFRALQKCREMESAVLWFSPGRYDFWPDLAYEKEVVISNHDNDGRRKIAFPLVDMKQISIEAPEAEFVRPHHSLPARELQQYPTERLRHRLGSAYDGAGLHH